MHPDIIDGYRLRDLQRTVTVGKATLTNELSETILMIEDCGRRTLIHPCSENTGKDSISVSWATDCDDTETEHVKVIKEEDFQHIPFSDNQTLRLTYLQSLPATIVIGSKVMGMSSALLRDLGRTTVPIILSNEKELITKWAVVNQRPAPVVYHKGAGRITVVRTKAMELLEDEIDEVALVDTEDAARKLADDLKLSDRVMAITATMLEDFTPVDDTNTQTFITNEHKIITEETKQEGVQLQVAKSSIDALTKMAS